MRLGGLGRLLGAIAVCGGGITAGTALLAPAAGAQVTGIDAAPPAGSGGFFDSSGPITTAQVGENVSLVVTARQLGSTVTPDGSITLSWNPTDFHLTSTGTDQTGTCTATPGNLTCSYTDFGQRSKSVTYSFTALNADPNATVAVSAKTDGPAVKRTFQLAITSPVSIGAPAPKGTGGFYDASGKAVTSVPVNQSVSLVVTALQSGTPQANGTFALAYDPAVLAYQGNGDTTATCATGTSGSTATVTCHYGDLSHAAKSDAFRFLTKAANPNAAVTATVTIGGASATQTFPLAVTAGPSSTGPATNVPTAKAQCKRGGWQQLTTKSGRPFKNQGACVSYVATGKHRSDTDDHHDADGHGHGNGQGNGNGQGIQLAGFHGSFHGHGPQWFLGAHLGGHHGDHHGGHHGDHAARHHGDH